MDTESITHPTADNHVSIAQNVIKDFLTLLRPQGLLNLVAIIPDGPTTGITFEMPIQVEDAADWAFKQNDTGKNLYFTVNPVKEHIRKKPSKQDIEKAEYAHVDIDPESSVSYDEGRARLLDTTVPELEGFDPKPAFIVDSGNGFAAFWRLEVASIEQAEKINKRLIQRFGGDTGTHNIDRLMRLPGTLNYPSKTKLAKGYPVTPSTAALRTSNKNRCTVEQLQRTLPEVVSTKQKVSKKTEPINSIVKRDLTKDQRLQVEKRLDALMLKDTMLRSRWDGSKAGLTDNSRSARDFSIVSMLKARGFTFSETAYLLTHRFEHGKGAENTERDIERCWERSGSTDDKGSVRGWVNGCYTSEEAAQAVGVNADEFAGLDPYSILRRGLEEQAKSDQDSIEDEVVKRAYWKALETMNLTFAKTMIGGKVAIIREFIDPSFGTPTYAVMAPPQLKEWYRGIVAYKVKKDGVELTNLGDDWLSWPGQRRYNTMTFAPGSVGDDIYNSWTGFPVQQEEGDWSLMKQLMREGLCDGNEDYYNWLLDWMAVGIQQPTKRYGVATVLRGEKGVGKGQFAKWYGKLFGNHFLHLANAQHLVGNFNAHLERSLLVFADELIWGGNKQQEGVLKALVTEELIPIERKGWDTEMRKNYARLLVASNEEWAVPAGVGERRWFILDVSSKFRQNTAFFRDLTTQMESGGQEAMMFELMNREIKTDQRDAPKTKALAAVATLGLDDVAAWLYDSLQVGEMPDPVGPLPLNSVGFIRSKEEFEARQKPREQRDRELTRTFAMMERNGSKTGWPYAVDKQSLYGSFEAYVKQGHHYRRIRDRASFFKRLKTLLPSVRDERPRVEGKPERIILLPSLEEARAEFKCTSGLDFDFEEAA